MPTVDPPPPLQRPATVQYLLIAFAVAGAALVLAIGSIGIALMALGWAVSAKADTRGSGGSAPDQHQAGPAAAAPQQTASPQQTAAPDAGYRLHYRATSLRVPAACGYPQGLDLDEPRVSPDAGSDLSISGCSRSSLKLDFENDVVSTGITGAKIGPVDCSEAIRLGPGPPEITPAAGQSLCVRTSRSAAASEGHQQLYVLLHVDTVAADATMTLTATAWDIPG